MHFIITSLVAIVTRGLPRGLGRGSLCCGFVALFLFCGNIGRPIYNFVFFTIGNGGVIRGCTIALRVIGVLFTYQTTTRRFIWVRIRAFMGTIGKRATIRCSITRGRGATILNGVWDFFIRQRCGATLWGSSGLMVRIPVGQRLVAQILLYGIIRLCQGIRDTS